LLRDCEAPAPLAMMASGSSIGSLGASALECAALLDTLHALELVTREEVEPLEELLVRIVAMPAKMAVR